MIAAQIKKGNGFLLDSLEDYLLQTITLPEGKPVKTVKFNYYNFIETLCQLLNEFAKSKAIASLNLFLVDYYARKYARVTELYRHFFGLTQAWKRFIDVHEDAKLLLSLLSDQRNSREVVKRFLKIRKTILKTIDAKILQEIPVTHSDALTICHMLFSSDARNKVIKKINNLFISLKRKLVNTAKINGAVACQFFMSVCEQLENENYLNDEQQKEEADPQGDPRPRNQPPTNYELSFNEEYASNPRNNRQHNYQDHIENEEEDEQPRHRLQRTSKNIFQEISNVDQEWGKDKGILGLDNAKKSLTQLSRKDRDIDAKLHGYGVLKLKNYPEGWDEFIQNNKMQKEKLLHGARNT